MKTFDEIIPTLKNIFIKHPVDFEIYVNRDLNGRVRLVIDDKYNNDNEINSCLSEIAIDINNELEGHAFPPLQGVLYEHDVNHLFKNELSSSLDATLPKIRIVDRLVTASGWTRCTPASPNSSAMRLAFYSIKGGVGRSTALAITARELAESGKRVLVIDLDLESPGLSCSLLPSDRYTRYGIVDWLVEDLIGNGNAVIASLHALSPISHDGEVFIVPAYGSSKEYIEKLGRAWMPKLDSNGINEKWQFRLARFLSSIEDELKPDIVLLDCRAGITETASAVLTGLNISLALLFAIDTEQTWAGYRTLFDYWQRTATLGKIRDKLQIVGAMIPEDNTVDYTRTLREHSWNVFLNHIYDDLPAGNDGIDAGDSYDLSDESGPHYPWPIMWNRSFQSLYKLEGCITSLDQNRITSCFGEFTKRIVEYIG